jgi:hypothetical protein
MLEWYAAMMHGSDVRPGSKGKALQPLLPAGIWHRFGQTYPGLDASDNRVALDIMIALFRESAECVDAAISCACPADVHDRVMQHVATLEESL